MLTIDSCDIAPQKLAVLSQITNVPAMIITRSMFCSVTADNFFFFSRCQNDQRYLVLECVADERDLMLWEYIRDLHQKGPPPPPTATNPADRLKRP